MILKPKTLIKYGFGKSKPDSKGRVAYWLNLIDTDYSLEIGFTFDADNNLTTSWLQSPEAETDYVIESERYWIVNHIKTEEQLCILYKILTNTELKPIF